MGVLTVGQCADVFHDHISNENRFLRGVAFDAEHYFQGEIRKVAKAGKASGLQEATQDLQQVRSQKDRG